MPPSSKILFLYANVQPFLLAGIEKLIENRDAEVVLVHWPELRDSPTQLHKREHLKYICKSGENTEAIYAEIKRFDPDIVYNVGWMDRDYYRWCKYFKKEGKKTVMAMDTQWKGSFRQKLHCVLAPFTLHSAFTHAWVPGNRQNEYARRLGFKEGQILQHLLIPDTELFKKAYVASQVAKQDHYPKRFLYAGTLTRGKLEGLLTAFNLLSEAELKGWELMIIGNGPMQSDERMQHPHIIHKPFVQQEELAKESEKAGVFCLCSSFESWGTVIQEFAAAGMPLVVSKQCGASDHFLKDGYNGYICDGENPHDIKNALLKMIGSTSEALLKMGAHSSTMAGTQTPALWAETLMSIIRN